jgi:hypothetical protein
MKLSRDEGTERMAIVYIPHAVLRMAQRGISQSQVEET